jgi:hypothetical protein
VPDLWLAPYLPINLEEMCGPWRLVPFHEFARRHATSQPLYNQTRRLLTAYRLPKAVSTHFGAVVVPCQGRVGDDVLRDEFRALARALTAAVLDANPSLLLDEDEPNIGHGMVASENALLFGHPLDGGLSYAFSTGAVVRRLDARHAPPGTRLPGVAPPPELPTPLFYVLDVEYLAALYELLRPESIIARRLDRSIEWLGLVWSNVAAITHDARLLSLRVALEVLLGGGERRMGVQAQRKALSQLLDDAEAPQTRRTWKGQPNPTPLTALQWWYLCFNDLRNAIAHGDEISDADRTFEDGKLHYWHANDVLRRAIKRTVISHGGDPDLELSMPDRHLRRRYRRLFGEEEG